MSLISRILEHSRNARVPRALDPETEQPIPYGTDQPALVRLGAWMLKTSWVERAVLKWSAAITTALTAWLLAKGAGDNTAPIVTGVAAGLTFLYEQLASYLNSKATMKIPPRVGGQSLAPVTSTTSDSGQTFTGQYTWRGLVTQRSEPLTADEALWLKNKKNPTPPKSPIPEKNEPPAPKQEGFPVEFEGKVYTFDSSTKAYIFRAQCRAEGKTVTVLF